MAAAMITALIATGCASNRSTNEIVVMAPSSMVDMVESLAAEPLRDLEINPTYAGSYSLVAQLRDGAHADVLITASRQTMNIAVANGSVGGDPVLLAENHLVVAVADGNPGRIQSLADLALSDRLIGLCAIEVPCGSLAALALDSLELTVAADTFEPNVRSLATKIQLGELDAGLIYQTDALALGLETVADDELSLFSTQYLIASVSAEPPENVRLFIDRVVSSTEVREILISQGFTPA